MIQKVSESHRRNLIQLNFKRSVVALYGVKTLSREVKWGGLGYQIGGDVDAAESEGLDLILLGPGRLVRKSMR